MATTTTTTGIDQAKSNAQYVIPFDVRLSDNLGYFYGYDSAINTIHEYQTRTGNFFCLAYTRKRKNAGDARPSGGDLHLGAHKIFWSDSHHSKVKKCRLAFDGVPFVVQSSRIYDCQYGTDRNLGHKQRYRRTHEPRQLRTATTKKQNCPAMIYLRSVVKFPDFKITADTEFIRRKGSALLQAAMKKGTVFGEQRTYVHFPGPADHRNHSLDETRGRLRMPVDPCIKDKIQQLVEAGTTKPHMVRAALEQFMETEMIVRDITHPSRTLPMKGVLQRQIQKIAARLRKSQQDCSTVEATLQQWQHLHPSDAFFFRPNGIFPKSSHLPQGSAKQQLLLVFQSKWQQELLDRYGNEMCILDAVHHTFHIDLPLYLLVVKTPVDCQAAAAIVLEEESAAALGEALKVLQGWSPLWHPATMLCGRRKVEKTAVEQTLPGTHFLVCDYQREQEWVAHLGDLDRGQDLLGYLRTMAACTSEEQYAAAEKELGSNDVWLLSGPLYHWLEDWLLDHKSWVAGWRQDSPTRGLNTSNMIDNLHQHFLLHFNPHNIHPRHHYSISHLLNLLLEHLLPAFHSAHLESCNEVKRLGVHCRELLDKIRSLTFPPQDACHLRKLHYSLLVAHNTLLGDTHPEETKDTIQLHDPEVEFQQARPRVTLCPTPEYEVVMELMETSEEDASSSSCPRIEVSCVACELGPQPSLSTVLQHKVRVHLDRSSSPPRKRRCKKRRDDNRDPKRLIGSMEEGLLPPGLFQVLVPIKEIPPRCTGGKSSKKMEEEDVRELREDSKSENKRKNEDCEAKIKENESKGSVGCKEKDKNIERQGKRHVKDERITIEDREVDNNLKVVMENRDVLESSSKCKSKEIGDGSIYFINTVNKMQNKAKTNKQKLLEQKRPKR